MLGVTYRGGGYVPSVLYNKVRLFDAVQRISRNIAVVVDAISLHTP